MDPKCNPCASRTTYSTVSLPKIARSDWDIKHNAYFCPDCQHTYTLATVKHPNPPPPQNNYNCGCIPCSTTPSTTSSISRQLIVDPCFPPHPGVVTSNGYSKPNRDTKSFGSFFIFK